MATKKAGKKGGKGSAGKKSASKKAAKKSTGKKGGAKKGGAKATTKKAAAKTALFGAAKSCIDIPTAEEIIVACAPNDFDINKPLCEFLAPNQLPFLQQCILNQVLARGCDIDRSDIPAGCDDTLSDIIDAIVINAR